MIGCRGAVAVSSATAGMHIALQALDIGPGDEVITPSLTWVSTANMIVRSGATPVFIDVDRETLMASPEAFQRALTERTKAIIPVHFAGAAADLEPIYDLADYYSLPVIEDAAHALGTHYKGKQVGAEGLSVFSFHPIKNMTTAEGGMICSSDETLLDRMRRLRFHGLAVSAFDRYRKGGAAPPEVIEPGFKYNLPDTLAVLGLKQLDSLETFNAKRAALAAHYLEGLAGLTGIQSLNVPDNTSQHAWHLFVVRIDPVRLAMDRETFIQALASRNIGTGVHFRAVHTHRWYRENLPIAENTLPHTDWNSERVVSLPLFPDMTVGDVDDVISAIKDILSESGVTP